MSEANQVHKSAEKPETIYLKPCSGYRKIDNETGHTLKAVTKEMWSTDQDLSWFSSVEAAKAHF